MQVYRDRTGEKLTYQDLSDKTGISKSTLAAMASRSSYNATIEILNTLCNFLGCELSEILSYKKDV